MIFLSQNEVAERLNSLENPISYEDLYAWLRMFVVHGENPYFTDNYPFGVVFIQKGKPAVFIDHKCNIRQWTITNFPYTDKDIFYSYAMSVDLLFELMKIQPVHEDACEYQKDGDKEFLVFRTQDGRTTFRLRLHVTWSRMSMAKQRPNVIAALAKHLLATADETSDTMTDFLLYENTLLPKTQSHKLYHLCDEAGQVIMWMGVFDSKSALVHLGSLPTAKEVQHLFKPAPVNNETLNDVIYELTEFATIVSDSVKAYRPTHFQLTRQGLRLYTSGTKNNFDIIVPYKTSSILTQWEGKFDMAKLRKIGFLKKGSVLTLGVTPRQWLVIKSSLFPSRMLVMSNAEEMKP